MMVFRRTPGKLGVCALPLALYLVLSQAFLASGQTTSTWTGGGANNNWSTPANWGGTAPVSGNALTFSGSARQTNTNDVSGLANLNTITFNTAEWNITGNAVTVTNAFTENAAGSNTWGLPTTLGGSITINQGASGDILNFTGVLSGSGSLSTVAGSGGVGTVFLSNTNNSFTGSVTINSATAVFYSMANGGVNSSFGAGSGTIQFGATASGYEGSLIYAGTNNCSTSRAFAAEARTTGSPVFNNNSPNNSSLTFNGGWNGRGDLNPFTILLQGTSTGANIFNGVISQTASPVPVSVQVNGPGTWIFAANNTYQGTTTINGGVLQLGSGAAAGNAGPATTNTIIFAANGTLGLNRNDSPVFPNNVTLAATNTITVAAGRTCTLGGLVSGTGTLVNSSPGGALVLTNVNTYSGNTIAAAGRLSLSGKGSISNSPEIDIAGGAVFDVAGVTGGFSMASNQVLKGAGATGTINGGINLAAGLLVLTYAPGTPVLAITGGSFWMTNNNVTLSIPGNTILSPGSYELISPGNGGSVIGTVAASVVLANDIGDQVASLSISNGGLYLVVSPSTATIPTVVSLASSPNPSTFNTVPVTLTAMVSPAPTNGEVITFMDGASTLGLSPMTNGCATLSLGSLAMGLHLVTAVYGGDGLYLSDTSAVVTQIVNEVTVTYPQGPAFPLFMYEIQPGYSSLAAYGWNIVQEYGLNTNSDVNAFLQGALANNLAGPALIPDNGTNDPYTGWSQAATQSWVQSIAVNTNLAWWYLPEQMSPAYPSETNLLANYTAWTRLYDPEQRPTYEYTENSVASNTMKGIIPYPDIIGVSCYCEDMGMPHAWIRYKLQQVGVGGAALAGASLGSNYIAGQKTLVAVLSIAQFTNNSPSEPTLAQTYHDFWSAIASGAQGIAVWSYFHALNDDPANLTNNLNELNLAASQITGPQQIGSAIIDGTVNSNVTFKITSGPASTVSFTPPGQSSTYSYPSLNVLSKTWNGSVYIIAVNSTSSNVTATISNVPSASATIALPLESRSVEMNNGVFSDAFAAWGVHVYMAPAISAPVAPDLYTTMTSNNGSFTLSCSGPAGQTYRVLASTNLALPLKNWQVLTNGTFGVNLINFTDHPATNSARFYRLASP